MIFQKPEVRRLKSSSSLAPNSLIEVFERGLRQEYEDYGCRYSEVALGPTEIFHLLQFASGHASGEIPPYLLPSESEIILQCSLSQRLIDILPALVVVREKHDLVFFLEVYINSLVMVFAPLQVSLPLMRAGDCLVVNTQFSRRCLTELLPINPEVVIVRPPIPELCLDQPSLRSDRINQKKIKTFSRVIPDKGCHELIKAMMLLSDDWELHLYGFHRDPTEYESHLLRLIQSLGLQSRVYCHPLLQKLTERRAALTEADVVVNISTSLEETMGKAILEALSRNKPVVANRWNGFPDLIPSQDLISTHWSCTDGYHVSASDIALAIERSHSLPNDYPRNLYHRFLAMRENELRPKQDLYSSHPMLAPLEPNREALSQWLLTPRSMSLRENTKFLTQHGKTLSAYFAPNAIVVNNQEVKTAHLDFHPRILFCYCLDKKEDPFPYLKRWLQRQLDSPYREIAQNMLVQTGAEYVSL